MSNTYRVAIAVSGLVLLVTVLLSFTESEQVQTQTIGRDKEQVRIGVIVPLTGEFGFVGQHMQAGMRLAVAQVSDLGIQLKVEDDESLSSVAVVNAWRKLNVDAVDVVLNSAVNTIKVLAPLAQQQRVPVVVVWDSNQEIAGLNEYVYGFGYATEASAAKMAAYVHDELGVSTVAVVSAHDEWSELAAGAFRAALEGAGGTVLLHEKFEVSEPDYRTVITKIKQSGAGAVFYPLFPEALVNFTRQAKELGYEGVLATGDGMSGVDLAAFADVLEGVYAVQPWLEDESFRAALRAQMGTETDPIGLAFAGLGHDAVQFVAELARGGKGAGEGWSLQSQLQRAVGGGRFRGVLGEAQWGADRQSQREETVTVTRGGAFVPLRY